MDVIDVPDDDTLLALATALGARLREGRHRLVTAESCTGGWIAKTVTDIAGCSDWFECGLAAYSYEAKQALLGVRPETLEHHGAVSRETVIEMVSGALVALRREHRGRGHRHRRSRRRHRRQAGRHRVDRLEAARRLSQGRAVPFRRRSRGGAPADRGRGPARAGRDRWPEASAGG